MISSRNPERVARNLSRDLDPRVSRFALDPGLFNRTLSAFITCLSHLTLELGMPLEKTPTNEFVSSGFHCLIFITIGSEIGKAVFFRNLNRHVNAIILDYRVYERSNRCLFFIAHGSML